MNTYNEWIDCNLPVYYKSKLLEEPDYPMLEDDESYEEGLEHPKLIQYEKEINHIKKFNTEVLLADSQKSFYGLKLIKPGILVEVRRKSSNRIEQILIGHCDHEGSVCGDFGIFDNGDFVIRYKIVWEGQNPAFMNIDY